MSDFCVCSKMVNSIDGCSMPLLFMRMFKYLGRYCNSRSYPGTYGTQSKRKRWVSFQKGLFYNSISKLFLFILLLISLGENFIKWSSNYRLLTGEKLYSRATPSPYLPSRVKLPFFTSRFCRFWSFCSLKELWRVERVCLVPSRFITRCSGCH